MLWKWYVWDDTSIPKLISIISAIGCCPFDRWWITPLSVLLLCSVNDALESVQWKRARADIHHFNGKRCVFIKLRRCLFVSKFHRTVFRFRDSPQANIFIPKSWISSHIYSPKGSPRSTKYGLFTRVLRIRLKWRLSHCTQLHTSTNVLRTFILQSFVLKRQVKHAVVAYLWQTMPQNWPSIRHVSAWISAFCIPAVCCLHPTRSDNINDSLNAGSNRNNNN